MIWAGIVFCILLSMLLSGLESSILSVSMVRVRHRAKEKERGAVSLMNLLEHRERLLASVLLVNTMANLAAFAALTTQMVSMLGFAGYLVSFAVALPVYLLLIELVPKSVFRLFPYRMLLRFVSILKGVYFAVSPVILIGSWIVALMRGREEPSSPAEIAHDEQRDEFRLIAKITEKHGELGQTEASMIRSVLDFQQVAVRDVTLPMANVTALPANMPVTSAIAIAHRTHFSHFPVMDDAGQLIGLLNVFEALRGRQRHGPVYSLLRRLVRVSTDDSGTSAIRSLRKAGSKIAAAYFPDGRLAGIVTLHDLVDRLINSRR